MHASHEPLHAPASASVRAVQVPMHGAKRDERHHCMHGDEVPAYRPRVRPSRFSPRLVLRAVARLAASPHVNTGRACRRAGTPTQVARQRARHGGGIPPRPNVTTPDHATRLQARVGDHACAMTRGKAVAARHQRGEADVNDRTSRTTSPPHRTVRAGTPRTSLTPDGVGVPTVLRG